MKTLAASQLTAGVNFWDAPGHSMAGSNDLATRALIFDWIARHEKTFYLPRKPDHPIGVYFSPTSRNFDSARFLASYRGVILLLLQNHLALQVVTPRTLSDFRGETLVLPDVLMVNDAERAELQKFVDRNGRLIIAGADATRMAASQKLVRFPDSPGTAYLSALEKDFATASKFKPASFLAALEPDKNLTVKASALVASNTALVEGKTHIFLANFAGLVPHANLKPSAETSASISIPASRKCELHFLPFLGEEVVVTGKSSGNVQTFSLPAFDRAAVAWLVDTK
jgi:hypothetical protein